MNIEKILTKAQREQIDILTKAGGELHNVAAYVEMEDGSKALIRPDGNVHWIYLGKKRNR